MAKIFVICEKPSVAIELAKAIGGDIRRHDGYLEVGDVWISWAFGHLLENAKPDEYDPIYIKWDIENLPFFPDILVVRPRSKKDKYKRDIKNSDGSIVFDEGIVKQLKVISVLLKKADTVVNAGDSAREGQLIVDEILTYFKYTGPCLRLWLQEMNTSAIKTAWKSMKSNAEYLHLYESALGRASLDFLIGMNLTRAYTTACRSKGHDMVVHIGRVQTPITCIVVARDLEIETFIPKDFFVLKIDAAHSAGTFKATWVPNENSSYLDIEKRVTNKSVVDAIAARVYGKQAIVLSYSKTPKSVSPPLPFSLGDLQKVAFKIYGLSATKTLDIAQALYEKHKLLSYPRTDYSYLPEGDHQYGSEFISAAKSNFGDRWDFPGEPDFTLRSPAWNNAKIGDHFAIRPTSRGGYDLSVLSPMEFNIYKLVVRQFLAQFYPPYKYDASVALLECEGEKFKATGKLDKSLGWKILFKREGVIKEIKDEDQVIPPMATNDSCLVAKTYVESKKTSPPSRFDTASLLDAMEKPHHFVEDEKIKKILKDCGIGTPATRGPIIEALLEREYLQEITEGKKKFFISTEKARFLYKIVPQWLRTPDLTALSEQRLKEVESGETEYTELISKQRVFIGKLISDVKDGKVASMMPAIGTFSAPKRVGKKGTRTKSVGKIGSKSSKNKSKQQTHGDCPKCNSGLVERKSQHGVFFGCSSYPVCKHTQQEPGKKPPSSAKV
jgi:DNA topoisomerase-3